MEGIACGAAVGAVGEVCVNAVGVEARGASPAEGGGVAGTLLVGAAFFVALNIHTTATARAASSRRRLGERVRIALRA